MSDTHQRVAMASGGNDYVIDERADDHECDDPSQVAMRQCGPHKRRPHEDEK